MHVCHLGVTPLSCLIRGFEELWMPIWDVRATVLIKEHLE